MKYSKATLQSILKQVPVDYYESGKKSNVFQKIWHGKKWEILNKQLTGFPKKILDSGCASGHIAHLIKEKFPDSEVFGVDIYSPAITYAKKIYPNIEFKVADAQELPFKSNLFDVVLSSEVLEHVVDPKKTLLEIKRVLNPKGYAIVEMDSGSVLFSIVWYLWKKLGPGAVWRNSHLTHFNSEILEKLIRNSGFKVINKKFSMFGMAVFFKLRK